MSDAQYNGINWGPDQEAVGLNCLNNFDAAFYQNQKTKPKWLGDTNEVLLCGMVKALLDAHRLVWCAQLRYDIRTGAPIEFPGFAELVSGTPNPVGSSETRVKVRQFCAGDPTLEAVPALYDVLCFEVLQAIRSSRPIKEPKPLVGSGLDAVRAELGAVPVALVALGVAAIAGATYLGASASVDFSKAWSAIEIEKAWAVQRAWAEVQVAQQKIAAGQTVELSDWSKMRAAVATASQSSWGPLAMAGALALVVGGGAYLMREHGAKASTSRQNPSHFAPRRRRRLRRKNPATAAPKRKRNAAPKRKRNAAPKRKRNAAPKRKRNAVPKRNPGTVSHQRVPAAFIRSQHAKGRSTAQAKAAYKLSHKKRAKKGSRGKR